MKVISPGKLFIVATPIGNLEDITFRAVKVLKKVDLIAAEDTRRTRILLNAYNIKAPLTPYHDHNKKRQGEKLLKFLLSGKSIALVSDAGTPGISDPGYFLINLAIHNNITIIPIPGVSAIITALSVSGLPSDRFSFEGFLPRKVNLRRKFIQNLKDKEQTLILYESPHRIIATLQDFLDIFGERWIVIARELTKIYEEIIRGTISEVLKKLSGKKMKGEFTILISSANYSEKVLLSRKE
jgi:16S rRNA (cytidine1402-2'-O)-methyltransferase